MRYLVNIYSHWLYHQSLLDPSSEDWITVLDPTSAATCEPATLDTRDCFFGQVKAYSLADRILDPNFRSAINEVVVRDNSYALSFTTFINRIIDWAFENIPSDRPILQFLVNRFCEKWVHALDKVDDVRSLRTVSPEFTARVMRRYAELRRSSTPKHRYACYLEHISDEEKKECKKPHVHYDPETDYGYLKTEEEELR